LHVKQVKYEDFQVNTRHRKVGDNALSISLVLPKTTFFDKKLSYKDSSFYESLHESRL
jgi:hypothetical protein